MINTLCQEVQTNNSLLLLLILGIIILVVSTLVQMHLLKIQRRQVRVLSSAIGKNQEEDRETIKQKEEVIDSIVHQRDYLKSLIREVVEIAKVNKYTEITDYLNKNPLNKKEN